MRKQSTGKSNVTAMLEQIGTYFSLLGPILSLPLSRFLPEQSQERMAHIAYLGIVAFSATWLLVQYFRANTSVDRDGSMPSPEWFWSLLTHKISYFKEELDHVHAMVFVPPGKEPEARDLEGLYNSDEQINLLFHYILMDDEGKVREDEGGTGSADEFRPIEILRQELRDCAAIILLDDCEWQEREKLMDIVDHWSNSNSARPVIALRLKGRGTLRFSWRHLRDVVRTPQMLINALLAQSINRGAGWHSQSGVYRLASFVAAILFLPALAFGYYQRQQAARLQRAVSANSSERNRLLRGVVEYRTKVRPSTQLTTGVLKEYAHYFKSQIARTFSINKAPSLTVILFGLSSTPDLLTIQELAATRDPRAIEFEVATGENMIEGIIACALHHNSYILWEGNNSGDVRRIRSWRLDGTPQGEYVEASKERPARIEFEDDSSCSYKVMPDDPRKKMLCGPLGSVLNSDTDKPYGGICVSIDEDWDFLEDEIMHKLVELFGDMMATFRLDILPPKPGNGSTSISSNNGVNIEPHAAPAVTAFISVGDACENTASAAFAGICWRYFLCLESYYRKSWAIALGLL